MKNKLLGFTLIELLSVIGIIGVLAMITLISFNPSKKIADSRNSQRTADVEKILSAINTYMVDNSGSYPTGLSTGMAEQQLGSASSGATISSGGCAVTPDIALDLTTSLAKYLPSIPADPQGTEALTKYAIVIDTNGIVTVKACGAENKLISVSR